MHVQTPVERLVRPQQDAASQKFTTTHLIRSLQQEAEKLKLCCTQRQLRFAVEDFAGFRTNQKFIDDERSEVALQPGLRAGATRNGPHSCEQFSKAEWLRKVIIGSEF